MSNLKEEEQRILIANFYNSHISKGKSFTVKYFKTLGISRSTVYNIISRVKNGDSLIRKKGSGRKPYKINNHQKGCIARFVNGKTGISQRKIAKKYSVSQAQVSRILKKKGIKYFKRQNAPASSTKQKVEQIKRLKLLKKKLNESCRHDDLVMDDESYFSFDGFDQPKNRGYYASNNSAVDIEVKYKRREKFPTKLLVWIAISNKGCSDVFFLPKNGSINSEIYTNECILKRLLPFLKNHYPNEDYIFWPDLATSHYSKYTVQFFIQHKIKFIEKQINPPNVPQLRPIEKFWSSLKSKVYENNWTAKNIQQLKCRIKNKLNEFTQDSFSTLLESIRSKISKAAVEGPDSILK